MKDSIKANIREVKSQIRSRDWSLEIMEELERTRKQIELDIKKEAKKKVVQILCDEE